MARERDSEVVTALKRIKEDGLAKFTREPDKGEEIYDEIADKVNQQVAIRATNEVIRHGADGRGGNANLAKEGALTKRMRWEAYAFLAANEKACWDFVFAECRDKGCKFKHHDEGKEAGLRELTTMIGESGVTKLGKVWQAREAERKAACQATKEAAGPSANNHEAKATLPKGASTKAPKMYKLTVAKGSAHMLHALRTREVGGGRGSTQVRRILRHKGDYPR